MSIQAIKLHPRHTIRADGSIEIGAIGYGDRHYTKLPGEGHVHGEAPASPAADSRPARLDPGNRGGLGGVGRPRTICGK